MTGIPLRDCGDGIYDDGEWISWEYIDRQIAIQNGELKEQAPEEIYTPEVQWLLMEAQHDEDNGIISSPKWGRIGELFVARKLGVVLSSEGVQGHDGRLGNEFIEIKTITPHKAHAHVEVKRRGNFSLLAVVRVNEDHEFDMKVVRRDQLKILGKEGSLRLSWTRACQLADA